MSSADIRRRYIEFFTSRGHTEIPSAPLVPLNDPTTLFTSSGMQPLIPYLLGESHPSGTRLVDSQKSFRAQDIEEVGDNRHTTFFEMLGNWSLGDYFKKEQISWIWEFLTKELGLPEERLHVSVFEGGHGVPKDEESAAIWKTLGVPDTRISYYGVGKNWWSRSGEPDKMPAGEPGGPDSEVFFDFGEEFGLHEKSSFKDEQCHPNCDCGRFMEIANSVFMQYQKQKDGSLKELVQKNVDFGGGLERLAAAVNNDPDVFKTDLFVPVIHIIEQSAGKKYGETEDVTRAMRIIADHMKAAVMVAADGVVPGNKMQGYVLRRLIRRAMLYGRSLGMGENLNWIVGLIPSIVSIYKEAYPDVAQKKDELATLLSEEANRFGKSLAKGLAEIEKMTTLDAKSAFYLYESFGFPWEMTEEIAVKRGEKPDRKQFEEEFARHKELSRTAAAGMFKGGLADHSEQTVRLHTAHHLLLAALQKAVDPAIKQRGSNITAERLRMDINFARKLTAEEIKKTEELVNEQIAANLPVTRAEMAREEAEKIGAQMEFGQKYPERVSVYFVGPQMDYFSAEFCGGPHVSFTGELGHLTIIKEESAGAGVRRLYATLTHESAKTSNATYPPQA